MYKYKDNDIVSLNVTFRDMAPSTEDITQDELRMITSDANANLSVEELAGLKKRFKKIHYTILDMEQNRKGFGLTEDAMKFFVQHFEDTKEDKGLHNLFKDHDYNHIDSLMGRIVDTHYDSKNKRVRRTSLVDMRHPSAARLDMFQNLSTTLLHGKPVCSECEREYRTCSHYNAFPRSTVAVGIEDSLVSIPAYKNAKRDSLSIFEESLSNIDIGKEFFKEEIIDIDKLSAEGIIDKDKLAAESQKLEKEKLEFEKKEAEKLEFQKKEEKLIQEKLEAKKDVDIKNIKENIDVLKKIIEKDIIN